MQIITLLGPFITHPFISLKRSQPNQYKLYLIYGSWMTQWICWSQQRIHSSQKWFDTAKEKCLQLNHSFPNCFCMSNWGNQKAVSSVPCRDDLLVTNPKRVQEGINRKACNCLLLKVRDSRSLHVKQVDLAWLCDWRIQLFWWNPSAK